MSLEERNPFQDVLKGQIPFTVFLRGEVPFWMFLKTFFVLERRSYLQVLEGQSQTFS